MDRLKVLICIQARSTSTRLPAKVHMKLGSKRVLDHVIDAAQIAANYLSKHEANKFDTSVVVAIPYNDPIKTAFAGSANFVEGPEHDVLERYRIACQGNADYVVRVTADCPLIPSFVISRAIKIAVDMQLDYVSNVHEKTRMTVDGFDVEVLSAKALGWLLENASTPSDREHVTTALRREMPRVLQHGFILNWLDLSDIKLSIDTPEDFENVSNIYRTMRDKEAVARVLFGKNRVFKI